MADLKLTAARLDVLKGVAAGEVKHHTMRKSSENYDEWRPGGYDGRKVTKQVEWLRDNGLIAMGPKEHGSFYALAPWRLTEAGETYLKSLEA